MYGLFGIIGILIPLNFRQPFSSRNLIEFWKGWHISLSNVLKELFYNPTKKILNSNIAIIVVFIGSAMWHGITINFFIWGVFHGILYLITKQIIKYKKNNFLPQIIMIFTIIFGRIIFSENNSRRLMQKMCFSIVNSNISALSIFTKYSSLSLFLGLIIVISEYLFYNQTYYKQRNYKYLRTPIMQIIIILMIFFLISNGVNYAVYGQR
jgi:D-alanyl-lipoteichoic acid acyltransferase DltB (MBOAT superfamily)